VLNTTKFLTLLEGCNFSLLVSENRVKIRTVTATILGVFNSLPAA